MFRYFLKHFTGTNHLDIFIEVPEVDGLLDPEVISRISAYQNKLMEIPEVDRALSVVDIIKTVHTSFHPYEKGGSDLPESRQAIEDYLLLLDLSDEVDVDSMMDSQRRTMRLSLHINNGGLIETHAIGEKALAASEMLGDKVSVEIMSIQYLLGKGFDEIIITGQKNGLIFAFVTILIMMAIALRSIKAGAWSMIPNLIPLLVLGGYIGWFWRIADSDVIIVLMAAIGIAVDDTIHFLMRYRYELGRTNDSKTAFDETFHYSGRAIIITTVILAAGFAPFGISDYFTTRMFGRLLPMCLFVALAADILLIPALVKLGLFNIPPKSKSIKSG